MDQHAFFQYYKDKQVSTTSDEIVEKEQERYM